MNEAFSKPGPEHARLKHLTGAWAAQIKHYPVPGGEAVASNGEYVARMDLGGYFLCREMNFGLLGYQGRGLTGFDPLRGVYVGTWADSTAPLIYRTEGHFDARGVFHETVEGPDASGDPVKLRMSTEVVDKNQMLFQMFLITGSEELVVLEIDHKRRRFVE